MTVTLEEAIHYAAQRIDEEAKNAEWGSLQEHTIFLCDEEENPVSLVRVTVSAVQQVSRWEMWLHHHRQTVRNIWDIAYFALGLATGVVYVLFGGGA